MELSAIGERVFAAEALLQRKKFKGKIKYLVKWKGWSSEHNTWEPEENILDQRLLDAFHRKMKQNNNSSIAPTTPSSSSKKPPSKSNSKSNQPSTSNGHNNNRDDEDDQSDDPKLLSPTTSLSSLSSTDAGSKKKSDTETKTLKRKPSDTVLSNIGLVSTKSLKESSGQSATASTSKSESSKDTNEKESNESDIKSSSSSHRSTMNKELKSLTGGTSTSPGGKKTSVNGTPSNDKSTVSNHLTNNLNNNMSQGVDSTTNPRLTNGTSAPSMNATAPTTPLHQRPMRKSSPPPELWRKQARVAEQILITDVTSNNMTITVRECRTHQGFFKERPVGANPGNRIQQIVQKPK